MKTKTCTSEGRKEKCSVCGLEWNVSRDLKLRGKYTCPACEGRRRSENMKKALQTAVKMIAVALLIGMLAPSAEAKAAVITGDMPIAGFSKVMSDFFDRWSSEAPERLQQITEEVLELKKIRQLIRAEGAEDILTRIVEAEATGGTLEQKVNVASCVINRCLSDGWPDTVEKVVFEKSQFSPVWDGRYYSVSITESSIEAVQEILRNGTTHNCIFFCSYGCKSEYFRKKGEPDFKDGIHRYYSH